MSDRLARLVLGVVSGLVLLLALGTNLPQASDGRFWSDGATYHAMAGSLAFDRDLEFSVEDLARVRSAYPGGPQGVFLKRVTDARSGSRLAYAKAALYPALAAPFVRVLGVDRGLLVLNAVAFVIALWLGYGELQRGASALAAVAGVFAVLVLSVAPVYLLWETPEILNLALVTAGLVAFRRSRVVLAALLLGLAVYSKPTHLAAALPLLLAPLLAAGASVPSRVLESARRTALLAAAAAACFGLGWLATGELNYQGGERKTFYDRYPFDPGVSFDSAGVWMTTDHVGPLVAGRDDDKLSDRVAPPRAPEELRRSFLLNFGYFWVGRFAGALPYFPGFAAALVLFLALGPRERDGWLALAGVAVACIGTLLIIPDNWYGGAGTIGNRYLLGFVPLGLLLLPREGAERLQPSPRSSRARCCCRCSRLRSGSRSSPASTRPACRSACCRPSSRCSPTSRSSRTSGASAGPTARRRARRTSSGSSTTARSAGELVRAGGLLAARRRKRRGRAAGASAGRSREAQGDDGARRRHR